MKIVRFETTLECKIPYSDEKRDYTDYGVLILPDSYSEDKNSPTRMVINCHGAGGTISTDDSQIEHQTLTKYLLANGYAVMDVNGLPEKYAEEFDIDPRNNIGSGMAMDFYFAAYDYCMKNFNLYKEIFVHGGSMGGITSTNFVLSKKVPVIAQTCFCPVLDTYNEMFLHPWCDGLPKFAMGKIFSFEKDSEGNYIYDEEKLRPYNPMQSTVVHPCPVYFCQCENDGVVSPEITKQYIARAKSQGVETQLVLFPEGGHEPQDYGEPLKEVSGIDVFEGEKLEIRPGVEGAFVWINSRNK